MPPFGVVLCAFTENKVSSVENESAMLPNSYFCSSAPEQGMNCSPTQAQSPPQPVSLPQPDTSKSCSGTSRVSDSIPVVKHSYRIVSPSLKKHSSTKHSSNTRNSAGVSPIRICREQVLVMTKPEIDVEIGPFPKIDKSSDDRELISSSTTVQCNLPEMEIDGVSRESKPTVPIGGDEDLTENVMDLEDAIILPSNEVGSSEDEREFVSSSSLAEQKEDTDKIVDHVSLDAEIIVHSKNHEEALQLKEQVIEKRDFDRSNIESEILLPATPVSLPEDETDDKIHCSSQASKVIVEKLPVFNFCEISAFEDFINDTSFSKKSPSTASISDGTNYWSRETANIKTQNSECNSLLNRSLGVPDILSRQTSQNPSNKIIKKRRISQKDSNSSSSYSVKKKQYLVIKPGDGMKLADIEYIANAVKDADPSTLRILHFVMFNKYGIINDYSIEQTKQNILNFSGFAFKEPAEFERKRQCLLKLPKPLLCKLYHILIGRRSFIVPLMTDQLMNFFMKPKMDPSLIGTKICPEDVFKVDDELKKRILEGPFPVVRLQRLNENLVKQKLIGQAHIWSVRVSVNDIMKDKKEQNPLYGYEKPNYILDGPGQKLMSFPNVVSCVYKARRRIINLLHSFLFGKPGSEEINRLNILEFTGFPKYQKTYSNRRVAFLKKLKPSELKQMCDIFSISAKNGPTVKQYKYMIKKLLQFLQAPSLVVNEKSDELGLLKIKKRGRKPKVSEIEKETTPNPPPPTKLRDFEKIRFNIECAPPEELLELNDLLFLKPSDYTEIHEKALNFTPFSLFENPSELHIRKTLLQYMSFEIIRKMARLLDIPAWDQYRSRDDLALTTLKFLTDLKRPVDATKVRKKMKSESQRLSKKEVNSTSDAAYRPHILKVQNNDNFYSENETNECFGSTCSGISDSTPVSDGSCEHNDKKDDTNSTIVIQRISESSYTWRDLNSNNNLIFSNQTSEEAISLREFAQHPSEDQLQLTIKDVICSNSWSITTGELLNKVLQRYSHFNLFYRSDFIKAKALEILQEMGAWGMDS